jgi:RNA polymerase sigma-70 factor (ECF subfamily)
MAAGVDRELADLMREALGGDEAAYAAFLRQAAALIRRAVARRLWQTWPDGVEDVVQETLLAVHLKRQTWRIEEPILPWLFAIARYKAIDAGRRRGLRINLPVEDLAEVLAGPDTVKEIEDAQHIEHAVGTLSSGQQRVVRSIAIEGRSIQETAQALAMKEGAVRVAFHRGLSAISQRFGRSS